MSLLSAAMEPCVIITESTTADPGGGFIATWTDGAEFVAAIAYNGSTEARLAEAQGVVGRYTVTTPRSFCLQYHDVFRRKRDGKTFRVTEAGIDNLTPPSAGLDMRNVSAEAWSIPQEDLT